MKGGQRRGASDDGGGCRALARISSGDGGGFGLRHCGAGGRGRDRDRVGVSIGVDGRDSVTHTQ